MIRVLHILTDTNIGGAGRYLVNYLRYRDRETYDISVLLPRGSALLPELRALKIPVAEVDGIADRSLSLLAISGLKQAIRKAAPDLVHTHGSFSGRVAAKQCGVRVVYTRHSAFPVPSYLKKGPGHWLYGALDRRYADHVIAVSPAAAENLLESGVPENRITVLMNGTQALAPMSPEERQAVRSALGIPEGVFTAGIFARLEPYKGQLLLLDAARILKSEGRDFRILIGGSGSMEGALRDRISDLDLTDRVRYLGFVKDVRTVLGILDLQLNCSYGTEASSLSLIEGMSLGLPTVASNYGGNPWQIDDGVTGLLFESRNVSDLVEKLRTLMDNPAIREELGEHAKMAYRTRFTGEIFAENIESVYRLVLEASE